MSGQLRKQCAYLDSIGVTFKDLAEEEAETETAPEAISEEEKEEKQWLQTWVTEAEAVSLTKEDLDNIMVNTISDLKNEKQKLMTYEQDERDTAAQCAKAGDREGQSHYLAQATQTNFSIRFINDLITRKTRNLKVEFVNMHSTRELDNFVAGDNGEGTIHLINDSGSTYCTFPITYWMGGYPQYVTGFEADGKYRDHALVTEVIDELNRSVGHNTELEKAMKAAMAYRRSENGLWLTKETEAHPGASIHINVDNENYKSHLAHVAKKNRSIKS